jgi:hypothetical protein
MPGQPQLAGWIVFDVTNLEVSADPGPDPVTIVEEDQDFDLTATFEGSGMIWGWLETAGFDYEVCFYAEGLGAAALERDLDCVPGSLTVGGSPYEATLTVPGGTLDPGVYKMACLVTFDAAPGLTGFYDSLHIQVYE